MKIATLLGPIALAWIATPTPSYANVQPAMAGHQWPTTDGCLTFPAWDAVANTCNDGVTRLLIVPIPVDVSSNKHVFATMGGLNSSSPPTSCQAMAISPNNTGFSFSNKVTDFSLIFTFDLGIVGVPAHGALHFECNLSPNNTSRIINVEYQ